MGVSNGEYANENTFNSSFMDREGDTDTSGKVDLLNIAAPSGAQIINVQRNINALASALGIPVDQVYNFLITWASTVVGTGSSSAKDKIEALVLKFRDTLVNGGHTHTGADGQGPQVSAQNLSQYNDYWAVYQKADALASSGLSINVTTQLTGKTPNGGSTQVGVLTDPSLNRVEIINSSTLTFVEDAGGQRVYGRVTEAAGVWTVTFYTNEAGVETAHNLSLQDISILYREVFKSVDRPTIPSNPMEFGSLDLTADIVDASASQRGLVSTGTQTLAGAKTFSGAGVFSSTLDITGNLTASAKIMGAIEVDSATTGSDQALAPTKSILVLTNASLASINNISSPIAGQLLILINSTGASVIVVNNSGGTAANRIKTGTVGNLTWQNGTSLWVVYDSNASRWQIVGGSGASSSPTIFGSRATPRSVATTGITSAASHMSTTDIDQTIYVEGDAAGENDISANPQIDAHTVVGARMRLIGRNSTDYIKLETGNGLDLAGGDPWYSFEGNALDLEWDGTNYYETSRRG